MVEGAVENVTGFVAFGIETTSGTPLGAPTKYTVLRGDMAPVAKKPPNFKQVVGQAFPTMPTPGPESFEMPLPMYPILDGNGLGTLDAAMLGYDDLTELLASYAYKHVISWYDLIKTLTFFCHYGPNDDDQYRLCAIDSMDFKSSSSNNEVTFDYKVQGASMEHLTNGAVLTDQFVDPADVDQLSHAGLLLELGQPGAAARDSVEELSGSLKRNLSWGALGKPGQHPAGSSSHNIVSSKNSNCDLKISLIDTDREELMRAMNPTNATPVISSRWSDIIGYIKARLSWYGQPLCGGINGEADYCNAGTSAFTFAGSYSGGDTVLVGEGEMGVHVYETGLGTNKDLAFKLKDLASTYEVVTGSTLGVAVVGKAITVTLATAGSTASAILAKLLESPAACVLMEFSLAHDSTGVGTVTEAQAPISHTNFKNGFRYRTTTGGPWSAWSVWRIVTELAQDLASGITVTIDDDSLAAEGDMFRFCSHIRSMKRITIPILTYSNIPVTSFKDGKRMVELNLQHTSADNADRPFITIINNEGAAYC